MHRGFVIAALIVLAAAAWWMYGDRYARLDGGDEPGPAAAAPSVDAEPAADEAPAGRAGAGVRRAFGPEALDVLEQAETFEILALHPDGDEAEGRSADEVFHGWRILGRAAVSDPRERRGLLDELYRSMNGNDGLVADCFNPRHALRAVRAGRAVDVVLCFECLQLLAYGGEAGASTSGYLLAASEGAFDAALKRHGLRKHAR